MHVHNTIPKPRQAYIIVVPLLLDPSPTKSSYPSVSAVRIPSPEIPIQPGEGGPPGMSWPGHVR